MEINQFKKFMEDIANWLKCTVEFRESDFEYATLRWRDGVEVGVWRRGNRAPRGTFQFSLHMPPHPLKEAFSYTTQRSWDESRTKINCDPRRGYEAVAKDIRRRLLGGPDRSKAKELYQFCWRDIDARGEHQNETRFTAELLAEAAGITLDLSTGSNNIIRQNWERRGDGVGRWVEFEASGDRVDLKLNYLTAEEACQVLAMFAEEEEDDDEQQGIDVMEDDSRVGHVAARLF